MPAHAPPHPANELLDGGTVSVTVESRRNGLVQNELVLLKQDSPAGALTTPPDQGTVR